MTAAFFQCTWWSYQEL